jgi:hypothetical protein
MLLRDMTFSQSKSKFPINSGTFLLIAIAGTLASAIAAFAMIMIGRGGPAVAGDGIGSLSLFSFLLTIQVFHGKSESKDEFLKKGTVRTAIATSLTVTYLLLLGLGLDPSLGINLNAGVLANFYIVYIFTISSYFITASIEKIVDTVKGKSSLFGS